MGTDFFPEGGKNASKSEVPPKVALGGVKFGVTEGGRGGGKRKFSPQLRTTQIFLRLFCPIWAFYLGRLPVVPPVVLRVVDPPRPLRQLGDAVQVGLGLADGRQVVLPVYEVKVYAVVKLKKYILVSFNRCKMGRCAPRQNVKKN